MDAITILSIVSRVITVVGAVIAVERRGAVKAQRRKAEKALKQVAMTEAEERQKQRTRRRAARRPPRRPSDGGWIFRGTGISPRGWLNRDRQH
jgi:hypothetical protein